MPAILALLTGCTATATPDPSISAETTAEALVQLVNDADLATEWTEIEALFSKTLLATVGEGTLKDTLGEVAAGGPWRAVGVDKSGAPLSIDFLLRSTSGEYQRMHASVDTGGLLEILWFGFAVDRDSLEESSVDIAHLISWVPAQSSVLTASAVDGYCLPTASAGTAQGARLPLASVSKLFVVGAAIDAVNRGALSWEDSLRLTETTRSLPAGRLAGEPAGTRISVLDAAVRALSESDNTAADLLLERIGREPVIQARMDMTGATTAEPFFSTREVFRMGWGADRLPIGHHITHAESTEVLAPGPLPTPFEIIEPRWSDGADWFASAQELCQAAVWLDLRLRSVPPELRAAAGVGQSTLRKTGGSPGVAALVQIWPDADGNGSRIVVGQFAADRPSDVGDMEGLFALATKLKPIVK